MTEAKSNKPTTLEEAISVINEHGFSRLTKAINLMWGDKAMIEYLNNLIISDRIDRQGFPPAVCQALMFLHSLHSAEFDTSSGKWIEPVTGWKQLT